MCKQFSIWILGILLLAAGCVHEERLAPDERNGGRVTLELRTSAAEAEYPSSLSRAGESTIGLPIVLVYSGTNSNASFSQAALAVVSGGTMQVTLDPSDDPSLFAVIANYPAQLRDGSSYDVDNLKMVLEGTTLNDLETILVSADLDNPQTTRPLADQPLPMTGISSPVTHIDQQTKITNDGGTTMWLTRAVAKAYVQVDTGVSDFTLLGVGAINAARNGAFFQVDPGVMGYTASTLTDYLDANSIIVPAIGNSTQLYPLYFYETPSSREPALIIQAMYHGSVYFYKLGFRENKIPLDILRNRNYIFTIHTAVSGYLTLEESVNAPVSNLGYDITVTDESSHEMVSNGQYYLGVSHSTALLYFTNLTFGGSITGTDMDTYGYFLKNGIEITTNADATMGIKQGTITASEEVQLLSSNVVDFAPVDGKSTTKIDVVLSSWLFWENKTASVTINLGNLEKTIHFIWKERPLGRSGDGILLPHNDYLSYTIESRGEEDFLRMSLNGGEDVIEEEKMTFTEPRKLYIAGIPLGEFQELRMGGVVYVTRNSGTQLERIKVYVHQERGTTVIP